jgi:hypothetical protein
MKQNTALIAALTVFQALFGSLNLPKSTPTSGAQSETTNKSKSAAKPRGSKTATLSPACEEIGFRLEPFLGKKTNRDETTTKQDWQHPGICYDGSKGRAGAHPSPLSLGVKFVIAAVPNPISTHLPLVFDRMIGVIAQVAEDDKYSYDSSWFPWDEAKDYSSFADQRLSQEALKLKQPQPGVVVFQRAVNSEIVDDRVHTLYQSGLIVFVVAEQPTEGIDRQQFENAFDLNMVAE